MQARGDGRAIVCRLFLEAKIIIQNQLAGPLDIYSRRITSLGLECTSVEVADHFGDPHGRRSRGP